MQDVVSAAVAARGRFKLAIGTSLLALNGPAPVSAASFTWLGESWKYRAKIQFFYSPTAPLEKSSDACACVSLFKGNSLGTRTVSTARSSCSG